MCKQITMRWLFCNKVEMCWKSDRYKKKTHMRDREMSGKMKRLKIKMEVQEITFYYFAWPQPRDLNFYVMMMMAIQKILLSVVSKFVVGVWDGLDACEISRPEILSQFAPDCDVFISCLDSHSDGTHSLQSIHCWDTDAETHFYKPDEETNSS